MKRTFRLKIIGSLTGLFFIQSVWANPIDCPQEDMPSSESVLKLTQRVADWQIRTFEVADHYRGMSAKMRARVERTGNGIPKWHDLQWHNAALYTGMNQWRKVAPNAQKYTDWLLMIGERNEWRLYDRPYHADDHAVGQTFLDLYREFGDAEMIGPTRDHFDWILKNPKRGSLEWKKSGTDCKNRWGWCDALFMAPPVWARLADITDDERYLTFMHTEYRATYGYLWDAVEHFFWRDSSFFGKTETNGRKLFWSRGNGWVFGGLALMIPDLPTDWEGRQFYIDLYLKLAESLRNCQRDDGTWSMGLLGGTEAYPDVETSGTAFYTFGLAWGINQGLLDGEVYRPVVLKAWSALTQYVTEAGMLTNVQPVGAAPGESFADKTEVYGVGAFLAAGSEVFLMVSSSK